VAKRVEGVIQIMGKGFGKLMGWERKKKDIL